jgi:hypothetical protein
LNFIHPLLKRTINIYCGIALCIQQVINAVNLYQLKKMKLFKLIFLVIATSCMSKNAASQDVLLNILTQNSGIINKNGTVFLEITVCNKSSTTAIPVYKLRPQISFPSELLNIPDTGHVLPPGWTLTFNNGSVIRLSNGTDQLPIHECRTILIAAQGKAVGGPSTISGNLTFSNGIAPGAVAGPATPGDNPADNASTTTVKVTR